MHGLHAAHQLVRINLDFLHVGVLSRILFYFIYLFYVCMQLVVFNAMP